MLSRSGDVRRIELSDGNANRRPRGDRATDTSRVFRTAQDDLPSGQNRADPSAVQQPAPAGLNRAPRSSNAAESEFLALGNGARLWLTEAAAAGTARMRVKMADAVATAKLIDATEVDWALGHAAVNARFGEHDLASILDHQARTRAGENHSLTQGTASWAALGAADTAQLDGEVTG